ncbi:MAG TPA: hypothetical protein VK508_05310 [Cyclobacteriaceae bacterium]|nr:hypothetical protein [Cyclobacteriaceae bacterium]
MKLYLLPIIIIILEVMGSCKPEIKHEPPLAVVVKYITAEMKGLITDARPYIDVKKVYSKHIPDKNVDYEKIWEEQMSFRRQVSSTKKINSCPSFYDFDIEEIISSSTESTVILRSKKQPVKMDVYDLELTDRGWQIVDIDYSDDDDVKDN